MAGYSEKPLASKLGIAAGTVIFVSGAPPGYRRLLLPLPEGVAFVSRLTSRVGIAHVFSTRQTELAQLLETCRATLPPSAAVWVSWPKKASKVPTDITEDVVRRLALPLGFVDVKVCAVTEVWSGLKLVLRTALR